MSLASRITDLASRIGTEIKSLWAAVNGKEPAFSKNTAFNKNFGTASGTVCQGNDSRLSDARTPTSHTHDDMYYTESEVNTLLDGKAASSHTHNYAGSSSAGGAANTALKLHTARAINGVSFDGSADIQNSEWFHSGRDFPNGTLITTNINYGVTQGDPWVLEIRGNSYGSVIPFDIQAQGYIYADTIINAQGYSNGTNISGLVALNVGGNLCFWFPNQGYWHGYNVRVYAANANPINRVVSITNVAKPSGTKEVAFTIHQSLHSGNFSSYAATVGHNHSGVYEPAFSKGTAFNKNFGSTAGTVAEGNDSRLSNERTPTNGSVTYAKIATDLTSRQAVSDSDINWAAGGVFTKTLSAATTFTFSNLQLNKVITLVASGNFTITLPAYCKRISGEYDGSTTNYIQFHCTNNASGSEEVWYTISKQAS